MNLGMKALIGFGAGLAIFAVCIWISMVGWYDTANSLENATRAQWTSNQNGYDAFWKSVREVAQVPEQYKDDFKTVLVADTQARYGADGSKAAFQWLQEHQINFDAGQYRKIQDVIESGRQDFKRSQNELADKQREVRDVTNSYWGGLMASHYGFPRTLSGAAAPPRDADGDGRLTVLDYPIVTSARTEKAFQDGKDDEVSIFDRAKK